MSIRTTPNAIFKKLAKIAPDIEFNVEWEEDPHFDWDGDGPDPREEGYIPHDVTVTASVVLDGEEKVGHEYLGGAYDKPGEEDPDIHGYLPQMLQGALKDLGSKIVVGPREWSPRDSSFGQLAEQAEAVRLYLKEVSRVRYEAQRRKYGS